MNVNEIFTEIRDRTDDTSITEEMVIKWVNQCQDMLAPEFGPQVTAVAVIEKGTNEYAWYPNLLEVRKAELLDGAGKFKRILNKISYRILGNETGEPRFYYIRGRSTGIYPFPSASGDKIKVYGRQGFMDVDNAEDIPELELSFHDLFVLYGCMRFYEIDLDEIEGAAYYGDKYEQRRYELKQAQSKEPRRTRVGPWL